MYINHNPFNLNDFLLSGTSTALQYNQSYNLISNGVAQLANLNQFTNFQTQQKCLNNNNINDNNNVNKNNVNYAFGQTTTANSLTFPFSSGKNNSNLIQTGVCQSNFQQNSRSTSASSVSSSSSSSTSSSSINSSPPASSNSSETKNANHTHQTFSKNNNLSVYPLNFAFYNPTLTCSVAPSSVHHSNSSSTNNSINQNAQSQPTMHTTQPVTTNQLQQQSSTLGSICNNTTLTSPYPSLNDKFAIYRAKETSNNSVLATLDPNYQLSVLSSKNLNMNPSPLQFSAPTHTAAAASLVNNETNLNGTSSFILFNPPKNHSNRQNFFDHHTPHYEPSSSIAYLPANTADLYFTNQGEQSLKTNSGQIPIQSFVPSAPSLSELAFNNTLNSSVINQKSSLIHTFNTKSSFISNPIGGNIKKRKRYKKPPEFRKVLPKNSLMLLHEYRPNVEYRFVCQSGPIHRPIFTMCVDINEHKFEGMGKTKKEARMVAAEKALDFLLKHPEYIQKSTSSNNSTLSSACNASMITNSEKEKNDSYDEDDEGEENENDSNQQDDNELLNEPNEIEDSSKRLKKSSSQVQLNKISNQNDIQNSNNNNNNNIKKNLND